MRELQAILADPSRAGELTPAQAAAALVELAALQASVAARL